MNDNKCPICGNEKLNSKNKYCSYKCRNIYINSRKDYKKQSKKISESLQNNTIEKLGELKEFKVKCDNCGTEFVVKERSKQFPNKEKYYCSRSCANSRKHTELTKNKIKNSLISKLEDGERIGFCKINSELKNYICLECSKNFKSRQVGRKFCSKECAILYKRKKNAYQSDVKKLYRKASLFRFSLNNYPDEFNFKLIEKYGWYKAKNYGNNPKGVSRDHLLSRIQGFRQMINPLILAHPANCELKQHNKNISKSIKCDISLDELLNRIDEWNKKYNEKFSVDKIYITEEDLREIIINL